MILSTDTASAGFDIDEAAHTMRFVRDLDAPPARVFSAWTEPKQVATWWDATGEKLAVCEIDLRPGGEFRFATSHYPDKPFTEDLRRNCAPDAAGVRREWRDGQGHAHRTGRRDSHDRGDRVPFTRASGPVCGNGSRGGNEPYARQPRCPSPQAVAFDRDRRT